MGRRSRDELERIFRRLEWLLASEPHGMGSSTLRERYRATYDEALAPRSLRRWLGELTENGRILAEGEGRARVYRPAPQARLASKPPPVPRKEDDPPSTEGPTLSAEARDVRRFVRRPLAAREPVGYRREFLESYRPNQDAYLPAALRRDLHATGAPPDRDRPAGTFARDILGRLLIDLSWASSRLEGNTYSRLDTQALIEFGRAAEGKDVTETQMILNHKNAIEFLVEGAGAIALDRATVLTLHAMLSENLLSDPAEEGALRNRPVQIGGTTFTPVAVPQVIQECFDLVLRKVRTIEDPFEQAFFLMVQLPYLQPFVDVNKRTSRLAANLPLIHANLTPLSFIDVPHDLYVEATLGVYELNRPELLRDLFAWAYARSAKQYRVVRESLGTPDPLRLRYREQIARVVRAMVVEGLAPDPSAVRERLRALDVDPSELPAVTEAAVGILLNLSEGAAQRYGIPMERFRSWGTWPAERGE